MNDDFVIGMVAGGLVWVYALGVGLLPTSLPPSLLDRFLAGFGDAVLLDTLLFYVLTGGVLGTFLVPLFDKLKKRVGG